MDSYSKHSILDLDNMSRKLRDEPKLASEHRVSLVIIVARELLLTGVLYNNSNNCNKYA